MTYHPKPSPFWWLANIRYFLYFLREFTGVIIALYIIYFLLNTPKPTPSLINWIAFSAAIIHSITWFWVTAKIAPLPAKKAFQLLFFLLLIIAWLALSYFLLISLYEK